MALYNLNHPSISIEITEHISHSESLQYSKITNSRCHRWTLGQIVVKRVSILYLIIILIIPQLGTGLTRGSNADWEFPTHY